MCCNLGGEFYWVYIFTIDPSARVDCSWKSNLRRKNALQQKKLFAIDKAARRFDLINNDFRYCQINKYIKKRCSHLRSYERDVRAFIKKYISEIFCILLIPSCSIFMRIQINIAYYLNNLYHSALKKNK